MIPVMEQDCDFDVLAAAEMGGRLHFAGEHTCVSARGTVHGAFLTGLRAAAEVMAASGCTSPAIGDVQSKAATVMPDPEACASAIAAVSAAVPDQVQPRICCRAMTAECLACTKGVSVEAFCADAASNPPATPVAGCATSVPCKGIPSNSCRSGLVCYAEGTPNVACIVDGSQWTRGNQGTISIGSTARLCFGLQLLTVAVAAFAVRPLL